MAKNSIVTTSRGKKIDLDRLKAINKNIMPIMNTKKEPIRVVIQQQVVKTPSKRFVNAELPASRPVSINQLLIPPNETSELKVSSATKKSSKIKETE